MLNIDTVIVIVILLVVSALAFRGLIRALKGESGCGRSCACKGPVGEEGAGSAEAIQVGDLRNRSRD